mgnify:FL=1
MQELRKVWLVIIMLCLAVNSGCVKTQIQEMKDNENLQQQEPSISTTDDTMTPEPVIEQQEETVNRGELEETLLVTTTVFSNGKDDQDGIDLIVYACDQDTLELQQLFRKKINATYPANTVDFEHGIFYFADADEERLYDNLYAYNLLTGDTTQLTGGKYTFDDLLMVLSLIHI